MTGRLQLPEVERLPRAKNDILKKGSQTRDGGLRATRVDVQAAKTHTVPGWGLRSLRMAWDCSPSPSRLGGTGISGPGQSLKMPGTAVEELGVEHPELLGGVRCEVT